MDANANGVADLDVNASTPGADAVSGSLFTGASGEFTLEALVNLPSLTAGNREIICMDTSGSPRPFQFRFTSGGLLELNNIAVSAVLAVGNENRNTSGEALAGLIDEVRISNVARTATDMIFDTNAPPLPPTINPQPENQFLGVGETLTIASHASGSTPLSYQWQKGSADVFSDIPEQTSETLSLPVTFEVEGDYRYIVSNSYGQATSDVARLTVGAVFSGLFPTGFDDAGIQLADNAVDPHYRLWASADPAYLGPNTIVPANVADYNANDAGSKWISPSATLGGVRGVYTYRTIFLIESADPSASTLNASVLSGGSLTVLLNGQPTGVANLTPPFPGPHRNVFSFTITTGFVAGTNTLDFMVDNQTSAVNAPAGNAITISGFDSVGTNVNNPSQITQVGAALVSNLKGITCSLRTRPWMGESNAERHPP
jgi:hypothetical protein